MSDWATSAEARVNSRNEYGVGPASGPGIYKRYKDVINRVLSEKGKYSKVLLFGATPELRDLVLDHGVKLVSLDISPQMLEETSKLMRHVDDLNEVRLIGDWRSVPFPSEEFDFVLGDGITNNIVVNDQDQLWAESFRVLKNNGYILFRDIVAVISHKRKTIKEIIETSHREKWHKYDLWFEIYIYSSDGGFRIDKQYVEMSVLKDVLERDIYGKGLFTSEEEEYMRKFTQGDVKTTLISEEDFCSNLVKYIRLVDTYRENDYRYCESFKFFLGQKI